MLLTSHSDIMAAFMASCLFQSLNLKIICALFTEHARITVSKILTHLVAGCVTFSFDGCFSYGTGHQ